MKLKRSLRLYVMEAWYSYRAMYAWQTPFAFISVKLVFSLFQMLLFIFMGRFAGLNNSIYIVIGNLLQLPAINGVSGVSMVIAGERESGTLPYLFGSPAPRAPLFLGRALFNILDGLFTMLIAIPLAAICFHLDLSQTDPAMLAVCVLVLALSSSGFGLIMGSIALLTVEGWTVNGMLYILFYLVCGINFPVAQLPQALQTVSYALPLTRGIQAARLAIQGAPWGQVAPLLGGEIVVGLLYGILGYALFRYFERRSLVQGRLDAI
jgi:ABC-2 type transport system permease protein